MRGPLSSPSHQRSLKPRSRSKGFRIHPCGSDRPSRIRNSRFTGRGWHTPRDVANEIMLSPFSDAQITHVHVTHTGPPAGVPPVRIATPAACSLRATVDLLTPSSKAISRHKAPASYNLMARSRVSASQNVDSFLRGRSARWTCSSSVDRSIPNSAASSLTETCSAW